jgi:steroid 5-alpha reductase family enzyme
LDWTMRKYQGAGRISMGIFKTLHESPGTIRKTKSRIMRWVEHVACIRCVHICRMKLYAKKEISRHWSRLENNMITDFKKTGHLGVGWTNLAGSYQRANELFWSQKLRWIYYLQVWLLFLLGLSFNHSTNATPLEFIHFDFL